MGLRPTPWPLGGSTVPWDARCSLSADRADIVWLVPAGLWFALAYVVAGLILCITIIGIPFGVQSFKLAATRSGPSVSKEQDDSPERSS